MKESKQPPTFGLLRFIAALGLSALMLYLLMLGLSLLVQLAPYLLGLAVAAALKRAASRMTDDSSPLWLVLLVAPFVLLSELFSVGHKAMAEGEQKARQLEEQVRNQALELDERLAAGAREARPVAWKAVQS